MTFEDYASINKQQKEGLNMNPITTDAAIVKEMSFEYKKALTLQIKNVCREIEVITKLGLENTQFISDENTQFISECAEYIATLQNLLEKYKRVEEIQITVLESLAKEQPTA